MSAFSIADRAGRIGAALALVLGVWLAGAGAARAEDPEYLTVTGGAFDLNGDDTTAALGLEYVDDRHWLWNLKPMTGAMVTTDAGLYLYAGLALDIYFGRRLVLTPSFAPGLYIEGGGKDLGHVIEFRSALRLAWRLDDRSRVGLEFNHISNAGLDDRNPGANQLLLTWSFPFRH